MLPGMNPRKLHGMMRKMGIAQVEIDATEVIIRTPEKDVIIRNPQVSKVKMMGQESYQITGEAEEKDTRPEISEEDIRTVMEQTGKGEEEARSAIEESKGDLAGAIIKLKEHKI